MSPMTFSVLSSICEYIVQEQKQKYFFCGKTFAFSIYVWQVFSYEFFLNFELMIEETTI